MERARNRTRLGSIALSLALVAFSAVFTLGPSTPAEAAYACPRFSTWEEWGGAWRVAKIEFRATDTCEGRNVRWAAVKLIRQCGPYKDSGWHYTYAPSRYSTQLNWVQIGMGDSILWGCRTDAFYNWGYY